MPVVLLGDVFDALTLQQCERLFAYVEDNVTIWKEELFFTPCKNNLLRMCNGIVIILCVSWKYLILFDITKDFFFVGQIYFAVCPDHKTLCFVDAFFSFLQSFSPSQNVLVNNMLSYLVY